MKKSTIFNLQALNRLIGSGLLIATVITPSIALSSEVKKVPRLHLSQGSWITDRANVPIPETETVTEDSLWRNTDLRLSLFLFGLSGIVLVTIIIHEWNTPAKKTQHNYDEQPKSFQSENFSPKNLHEHKPHYISTQSVTENTSDIFEVVEDVANWSNSYYNQQDKNDDLTNNCDRASAPGYGLRGGYDSNSDYRERSAEGNRGSSHDSDGSHDSNSRDNSSSSDSGSSYDSSSSDCGSSYDSSNW